VDGALVFAEVPRFAARRTGQHETADAPIWKYRVIVCHHRDPGRRGNLKWSDSPPKLNGGSSYNAATKVAISVGRTGSGKAAAGGHLRRPS
jgi:hypothetical protein